MSTAVKVSVTWAEIFAEKTSKNFQQKYQELSTHQMLVREREQHKDAAQKHLQSLEEVRKIVTEEMSCRLNINESPARGVGATGPITNFSFTESQLEVLRSVERDHGGKKSGTPDQPVLEPVRQDQSHPSNRRQGNQSFQHSRSFTASKTRRTQNWLAEAKKSSNDIRKNVRLRAEKRHDEEESDTSEVSGPLYILQQAAKDAGWSTEQLEQKVHEYEKSRAQHVSLDQQRLFQRSKSKPNENSQASPGFTFGSFLPSTPNETCQRAETVVPQRHGTSNLYENQNAIRGIPNLPNQNSGPPRGITPFQTQDQQLQGNFVSVHGSTPIVPPPVPPRPLTRDTTYNVASSAPFEIPPSGPPMPPSGPPMPPSRPTQNPNLAFNNPWENYSYEEKTPLRLNLKKFDGKNVGDEFMIFMEQFMALCGEKNIRPKKKLCYLMAFLEGPALQTVKQAIGRSLRDDSYQKALKALQDRFGGEERMKRNYLWIRFMCTFTERPKQLKTLRKVAGSLDFNKGHSSQKTKNMTQNQRVLGVEMRLDLH